MTNLWRRVLAGLTHSGPGYELPTRTEADLRATFTLLADRYDLLADIELEAIPRLYGPGAEEVRQAAEQRARTLRDGARDIRHVLHTGRIPAELAVDGGLAAVGEEAAS